MSTVSDYTAYSNATQRMQDSFDAERAQTKLNHERNVDDLKEDYNEDMDRVKKSYQEKLENEKLAAREEVKKLKEELYDAQGKRTTRESIEHNNLREDFVRYKDDLDKDAAKRVSRSESYSNAQAVDSAKRQDEKIAEALERQKESQIQEKRDLEDELAQYRSLDKDVATEKAKGKSQAIEEYEAEHIHERNRLIDSYEGQIGKLHQDQADSKDYFNRELVNAAFDNNAKAERLVRAQKKEFSQTEKDLRDEAHRVQKGLSDQLAHQNDRNAKVMSNVMDLENERHAHAIEVKDKTYQDFIAEKDHQTQFELNQKQAKIDTLSTTDDPQKVSPAVVERIRNQERTLDYREREAFKQAEQGNVDASRRKDIEERGRLRDNYDTNVNALTKKMQRDQDTSAKSFNNTFSEVQDRFQNDVDSLKEKNRKQVEGLQLKQAVDLSQLQKRDGEAMQEQRVQLEDQMASVRDESDFNRRTNDREWFMRTTSMRRDYENKLTEQQEQHDQMTQQLRLEYDKRLRDQDRTLKGALEERVRMYEHQLKQQELAFKEKERFLKEQSQEEIDKMRRANAHLIQKKS